MKNVTIKDKQNIVISDLNLYDDPTEFIEFNIANNIWGKPERIVREKIETEESIIFPDEEYSEEDVLERFEGEEGKESTVKIRADYVIEINDYKKVPKSVTRRQAKQALLQVGLLSMIESYMASAPMNVQIDWYDALEIQRDWSTLSIVSQDLNLSSDQVDDLFILAATF